VGDHPRSTEETSGELLNPHKGLPPKEPRSAIYAAMLIDAYPDEIRSIKPPNGVFKALAVVGRALRFKL
jgi:hypothetical protein